MKIASLRLDGVRHAALLHGDLLIPLRDLNNAWRTSFPEDLDGILQAGALDELRRRVESSSMPSRGIPVHSADWAPLVERPRNVWGVGLNFRQHAKDLNADRARAMPSGFHRPSSCLAGHQETIQIPASWGVITGEAEIGVIVGRPVWQASRDEARKSIAGYTALLDLTAEELLRTDTRYIGRSKAFPQSVVLGPILVTPDEWEPTTDTTIATLWDGAEARAGKVRDMTWDPWTLLSDFSHVFPWHPGDVLQTGTPGAVPLQPGGTLGARVEGLTPLQCHIAAR